MVIGRLIRLIRLDLQWRGRLHSYMWMDNGWDGMDGWDGYHRSKLGFGPNRQETLHQTLHASVTLHFKFCLAISFL